MVLFDVDFGLEELMMAVETVMLNSGVPELDGDSGNVVRPESEVGIERYWADVDVELSVEAIVAFMSLLVDEA